MEHLPILYHESKNNKLYSWKIWTEGADLVVEYGTVDGEKSLSRKTCTTKNPGKKNEVLPEEQAVREAEAQHRKKLEKKYSLTKTKAREVCFFPMLAHSYPKLYIERKKKINFPLDVQLKLNGIRCLAYWENDEVQLMSRGGKPINLPHLKEQLRGLMPQNWVLDGEIYIHGMALQDINRRWKKLSDISSELEYHIYDCFQPDALDICWHSETFPSRKDTLIYLHEVSLVKADKIKFVETRTVHNENEAELALHEFEQQGFEGVILRLWNGTYTVGHRSRDLLKWKNFIDDEFEIVGHEEAEGNDKGTIVWRVRTESGREFTVRPTGSREYRTELFQNAESYYGRMLTVKYQELSLDGIPIFGVGKPIDSIVREEEDI